MATAEMLITAARRVEKALQWFVMESQVEGPYALFFYDEHLLNEPVAHLASLHPEENCQSGVDGSGIRSSRPAMASAVISATNSRPCSMPTKTSANGWSNTTA